MCNMKKKERGKKGSLKSVQYETTRGKKKGSLKSVHHGKKKRKNKKWEKKS